MKPRATAIMSSLIVGALLLGGCQQSNTVDSGTVPAGVGLKGGGLWELGWEERASYPAGPCVQLVVELDAGTITYKACPLTSQETLFAVDFDDAVVIGYFVGDVSVDSSDSGLLVTTHALRAIGERRLFVQFLSDGVEQPIVLRFDTSEVVVSS